MREAGRMPGVLGARSLTDVNRKGEPVRSLPFLSDQHPLRQSASRAWRRSTTWPRPMMLLLVVALPWVVMSRVRDDAAAEPAASPSRPEQGFTAPDLTLETLDGESVRLAQLRGQVVLINFWATWCPPCRDEMPAIQEAYDEHREEGLVVLAVNLMESDAQVSDFAGEMELTFPILMDRRGSVAERYRVQSLPTTYFVDRSGVIQDIAIGGPISRSLVEEKLTGLLVQGPDAVD
jgi:cytochrome c biogenesis protein CcmG/thiol:disulfide interchange protein DsbE